ncbi:MAG: ATP-binding protein [Propionivibrio sp.]|uniref:ATP-binding protein n=1 Tax=Propionivibrio sp. TaxID=2212460 RepID=UPI001A614987|nr:ATP-binding protein [Propionivibrio sp.]MBL8413796.1 ATP-binding protein [Propionivibrio sp.]
MVWLLDRCFPASTEVLSEVRLAVRDACQRARGDKKSGEGCSEQMVLAINEACMNIIQHGYGFADGNQFTLRLGVDDDVLVALLLDNGLPACDADLCPRNLDELRPGGLGVHFMRELMDGVAYVQAPEGFANCLQLSKRI